MVVVMISKMLPVLLICVMHLVLHAHCDCVVLALCLRYVCVALALHMYCTGIVKFFFIRTVQ